jgi:creatinine amidohydrolase
MMGKYRMAELTAAEMRARLAGDPVVLVPLGSFEDQGPQAPMGDFLSAEAMAVRIAARAAGQGTDTLVAPVLPFGGADYFDAVPGAISLGQATLRAVLADMFGALLRHGIRRIVVMNGHGGNSAAIFETTLRIRQTTGCVIPSFYLWKVAAQVLPNCPGYVPGSAGHGADPLASIAAALFPALMRPDLLEPPVAGGRVLGMNVSGFGAAEFGGVGIDVPVEIGEIPSAGDPRLCSVETGAWLVEALSDLGARFVVHVAAQRI